ncbi:MAG: hypothetical protein FWD61_17950 [Phycisphaerales bacterium]|nr:hypothetical protein [Phycisphaerales bacterium]
MPQEFTFLQQLQAAGWAWLPGEAVGEVLFPTPTAESLRPVFLEPQEGHWVLASRSLMEVIFSKEWPQCSHMNS